MQADQQVAYQYEFRLFLRPGLETGVIVGVERLDQVILSAIGKRAEHKMLIKKRLQLPWIVIPISPEGVDEIGERPGQLFENDYVAFGNKATDPA